ncbi:LysM peptidoglycan-binding domain-containing protein [Marimonas sp. MJW-29]|uniref:LysM peptidoglycan-binding domain-containing protein n=1 Tax=Sulfitobacter sediminis TaxID=3234186 RepID=A0ABV3RMH5_9RHOB
MVCPHHGSGQLPIGAKIAGPKTRLPARGDIWPVFTIQVIPSRSSLCLGAERTGPFGFPAHREELSQTRLFRQLRIWVEVKLDWKDAMGKPRLHKVKKGETIAAIAKSYGHASGDDIWYHDYNNKLRKKHKTPTTLAPGDVLTIPLTKGELLTLNLWLAQAEAELDLSKALSFKSEKLSRSATSAMAEYKNNQKYCDMMVKEIEKAAKDIDGLFVTVDTVASIATMFVSLGAIAKRSSMAASATGKELAAINKEAAGIAKEMAKKPIKESAAKKGIEHLKTDKDVSEVGKRIAFAAECAMSVSSPSFWAKGIIGLWNGKSVGETLAWDPVKELKKQANEVKIEYGKRNGELFKSINQLQKSASQLAGMAKDAEARARKLTKAADAMPA